jgi:hypothetical protein
MRRWLVLIALLAAGCSSDGDDEAVSTTTTSTSTSTSATAVPVQCRGLGEVPAGGAVTWISEGRLYDESGCLVDEAAAPVEWGGTGDRVLLGGSMVTAAGRTKLFDSATALSRPTGTAVLSISTEGRLLKREVDAPAERDLRILSKHTDVVYHPAGRSIVVAGERGGQPQLLITDNEGGDDRPLLEIEQAKSVSNPVFTASGALLYTADHGDRVDLHRLEIGSDTFSTPDTVPAPGTIDHVVASPFDGGGVAWMKGECASAVLRAQRGGAFFETSGTEVANARPVGWMPDGGLVLLKGPMCQDTPGTLFVWRDGAARRIADNVTAAAVRAVLPPPPEPPQAIPQEAPA